MFNLNPGRHKEQPLARLRNELETLVDRFLSRWPAPLDTEYGLDRLWGLNLEDRDEEVILRAEIPGFEPSEVDVQVGGRLLTIKAEKKQPSPKTGNGAGRSSRSFYRRVRLPDAIDRERIEAKYHNGVLELHLPRMEIAKPKRIPVQP